MFMPGAQCPTWSLVFSVTLCCSLSARQDFSLLIRQPLGAFEKITKASWDIFPMSVEFVNVGEITDSSMDFVRIFLNLVLFFSGVFPSLCV